MKTAIGYVRVSTDDQAEDGYGLDAQCATIIEECARREWTLVDIVGEEGGAGAQPLECVGLQRALSRMDKHEADVLVVSKMDRLSRSLAQGTTVIERAARRNWSIVALDMGVDMSTPAGELLANMLLSAARFERRMIGQRTKEGLAVARDKGVILGRPSGLSTVVVERIKSEHSAGRSLRQIADALSDEAIRTSRGGATWHASSVRAVLARARRP